MTVVVKSTPENVIALPQQLLESLKLSDGEEVKAIVEGQTLRLARLNKFLALRGIMADDAAFDAALTYLNHAWDKWTPPDIA